MKILKTTLIIFSILLIIVLLFMFIASFSYENIFYNKEDDSTIVFIKKDGESNYKYSNKNTNYTDVVYVGTGSIVFLKNNKEVATGIYHHKDKVLVIDGKFDKNEYKKKKFKQVNSIFEYLKAIF